MKYSKIKVLFFGIMLLALAALAGCSTYQSATSYFNTYYNAKKQFNDAESELSRTPRSDQDTNYFAPPSNKTGGSNAKFDKVIEKCSKLIQYYPESNLIDDAMLLIGKSGVYLGETEMAIRKFAELSRNFPESDLLPEAKLWNAKALFFSGKPDEALVLIETLFPEAVVVGEENIAIESQLLAAQIYFKQNEYLSVAKHLEKAVVLSGDDALLAYAQFQLALCYDRLNEYNAAAKAYARVVQFNPELTLAFRARLRSGIMMAHADQIENALIVFQEMNDELLKPEEQALVDHEVANAYAMLGDSTKAFDMYQYVDTTYKRSDAAARSYYRQGLLMEEVYGDFKKAREYFDKAKAENQTSEIVPNARKRSEYLAKYFSIRTNIKRNDSLYFYLVHEDSLKEIEKKRREQTKSAIADSLKNDSTIVLSDSLRAFSDSAKEVVSLSDSLTMDNVAQETLPTDSNSVNEEIKQEEKFNIEDYEDG
ncbi:MAG: tetratricopeptide repeat protein [Ignavibacteriae bacterium]|nr:tetratricopeptide repeat protein [Ignavibacteriota bacterium]